MSPKKIRLIREMTVGERQTFIEYDEETGLAIRPDNRLSANGQAEWDRIMDLLMNSKDDKGKNKDLRSIVDGPGLLDLCLKLSLLFFATTIPCGMI